MISVAIVRTNLKHDKVQRFSEVLAPEECMRADNYRFDLDRERFIVCRAATRKLLAKVAEVEPRDIVFEKTRFGKPFVSAPTKAKRFHFNVSHSGGFAAIAITSLAEVGVDVEEMRPDVDLIEIARHSFASCEYDWLAALSETDRAEVFYRMWTLKEAALKAIGTGFMTPLEYVKVKPSNKTFTVTLLSPVSSCLSATELEAPKGYAVALAIIREIRCFERLALNKPDIGATDLGLDIFTLQYFLPLMTVGGDHENFGE
jgi:4'-phosphopantetheinyl transferase